MNRETDNILFDLDGTLTDPKVGIINSILYALQKLDIVEESVDELDSFIGPPLRNSFLTRYHLSEFQADKAVSFYREYFTEKGLFENVLYPGIADVLGSLHTKGFQLFVATSKPTVFADQILKHFDLDRYFTSVIGSNLDHSRSDKSEIISYALSEYCLSQDRSVMVGDKKHDIIGAKNNCIKSIGVTYGYGSLQELLSQQPDLIIHDCVELKSVFY